MKKSLILIAILIVFVIVSCKDDDKGLLIPKKGDVQIDKYKMVWMEESGEVPKDVYDKLEKGKKG